MKSLMKCFIVLALVVLPLAQGWFFDRGQSKVRPRHDMNQGQLRNLYNQPVTTVQRVSRPLDMWGGKTLDKIGIRHEGVLASTKNGQWLVHKGKNFGFTGGNKLVSVILCYILHFNGY